VPVQPTTPFNSYPTFTTVAIADDLTVADTLTVTGTSTLTGATAITGALTAASTVGGKAIVKTAAATLLASESGAECFFNSAAGDIYTLPTCASGLRYKFSVGTTITSNAAKVITASASEFILGSFIQSTDGTYTTAAQAANGSTIRAWSGNGTTTGGLAGDSFELVGISATQWEMRAGQGRATGSEATPFATS
jgi:hypothetical protein